MENKVSRSDDSNSSFNHLSNNYMARLIICSKCPNQLSKQDSLGWLKWQGKWFCPKHKRKIRLVG